MVAAKDFQGKTLCFRHAGYNIDENLQVASSRVSFQDEVAQKVNVSSTAFEQWKEGPWLFIVYKYTIIRGYIYIYIYISGYLWYIGNITTI